MIRTLLPLFAAALVLSGIPVADGQTGSASPTTSLPPAESVDERTTVNTVRIVLTGFCRLPTEVLVVADDVDEEIHPRLNQNELIFDTTTRFNARKGHVSLRMGPKPAWRTDCHQPTRIARDDPDPRKRQHWVAQFEFSTCPTELPVHQVSIRTDPPEAPVSLSYVRELHGKRGSSVDCAEGAVLQGAINDVRYQNEKLHLQIAPDAPNRKACGFVVNDPDARKYARPNTDELVVYEKGAVVDALRELRSKAKTCAAPSFSAPASKLDFQNLNDAKLKKLSMTVMPQPEPAGK